MPRFTTIQVSEEASDLVRDLEAALLRHCAADSSDRIACENTYAAVSMRRKALYEYLQSLEFNAHVNRTVTLRFD